MKMKRLGAVASVLVLATVWAEDYELPLGASDTISTNVTYTTMNIAGDLTVSGGAVVSKAKSTAVNVIGGSVTVRGKASVLASYDRDGGTTFTFTNNAEGVVGRMTVDAAGSTIYNVGARPLNVCLDDAIAQHDNGSVDILDLRGGSVQFVNAYNYSTLTARVSVVGNNMWAKANGYCFGGGMFQKGAFLFDLKDSASLMFFAGNQQAGFNEADAVVRTTGSGSITIYSHFNGYAVKVCRGAYFNHVGKLRLEDDGHLEFQTGDAIGPNVTGIDVVSGAARLDVARYVTLRVPCDVALSPTTTSLAGAGILELDCSESPRTLSAWAGNDVTLQKTGGHEAVVRSPYLSHVCVKEGVLRLAGMDCTVKDLLVAEGAELVVDGVTLTLDLAENMLRPAIRVINGGKIVYAGAGMGVLFQPELQGGVYVRSGSLVPSTWDGDARKYWRFVFKGTAAGAAAPQIRQLYLFDKDNHILNWCMSQNQTWARDDAVVALSPNTACWRLSSATNLVNAGESWQDYNWMMGCIFRTTYNGNNYPCIKAPVLNVDDPDSHLAIEMRLKDAAAPVTGYTLGFADKTKYANVWDVYASADGETWELVDARTDMVPSYIPDTYFTWDGWNYSQLQNLTLEQMEARLRQSFRLPGQKVDGLAPAGPIEVQVDAEAALDLTAYTEGVQTIDGLAIDASLGGGTIRGGTLAATGRIDLTNYDLFSNEPLSVDLDGTTGLENLSNWQVFVAGTAYFACRPSYDATTKKLQLNSPYAHHHVTATSTGDLQGLYPDKDIVLEIDETANFTNTVALTGTRSIVLTGLGRFVLTQSSPDYSGTITVSAGRLDGRYDNAYGTGTVEINRTASGTCLVILGSSTQATSYDNSFVIRPAAGYESSTGVSIWIVTTNQKTMTLNGNVTAYGDLYIKDDMQGNSQGKDLVYFKGAMTAEGRRIDYPCDSNVRWQGTVVCRNFRASSYYPGMGAHCFYSAENRIGEITCLYNSIRVVGADVLGGASWTFPNGSGTEDGRGVLYLDGYSQTLASLNGIPSNYGWSLDYNSSKASTLTLTGGVATATVSVALGRPPYGGNLNYGRVSLVVDAGNDDFVQIVTNSVGTTFGTVTVNNGTLRFAGSSSLTNTPSLTVAGGRLELDTTRTNAFAAVTNVAVGAQAALRVGAQAVTPFGGGAKTILALDTTSALELPEGAAVTVYKAFVGDRKISAGTYTGTDGAVGGARVLPQISGKGTLTVRVGGGMLILFR